MLNVLSTINTYDKCKNNSDRGIYLMKKKIVLLFCCMGLITSIISGCENSEKEVNTSSLNLCEVQECSEDGINEIVGLSGKTEYYCDQHYKAMENMAEAMFSDNNNDISESDSETEEDSHEIKVDTEEQESNKTKTDDNTVEGSISRGIVSFVSSVSKNGYTLTNPNKREGEDGSSLITCDVENSNDEFNVQYLVEYGHIQGIWINAMNEETIYSDNYKNCIIAMAISFDDNAEIESVTESVNSALNNFGEVIIENDMVFQFENGEFVITSN